MGPRWVLRQQLLEKHERPVYGIAFNDIAQDLQHLAATAGGRQISVYSLDTAASGLSLLFGYVCPDQLEELYVVKWMLLSDGSLVLAAAGACGHVHVVETLAKDGAAAHTQKCVLLGHGERINDIETHPSQSDLLLSCSKDESVRLWNVVLCTVLAVFSGAEGHAGEVLWAACHSFRPGLFASAGMDAVMIWSWHEHEASLSAAGAALDVTLQIESPLFMTTALHGDYVDCVAWHGDLLISKSVDNCLVMWRPTMDLDLLQEMVHAPQSEFTVLREFNMTACPLWFIRFSIEPEAGLLACGNRAGLVHVWSLDDPEQRVQQVQCPAGAPVRIAQLHAGGRHLLCGLEGGKICLMDSLDESEPGST